MIGWLASRVGTVFIERGASEQEQIKGQMQRYLQQQQNILFFPEGGTGDGSSLRLFQPRLFASAVDHHHPVLSIAIQYGDKQGDFSLPVETQSQTFFENVMLTLARKKVSVTLHIFPQIQTEGLARKQVAQIAQNNIAKQLQLPIGRRSTIPRQRKVAVEEV